MNRKYYLIKLVEASSGCEFWLRRDLKGFQWYNHGKDKEYKNLGSAVARAGKITAGLRRRGDMDSTIHVVEVTFEPCNPLLPDGYYRPVQTVVV